MVQGREQTILITVRVCFFVVFLPYVSPHVTGHVIRPLMVRGVAVRLQRCMLAAIISGQLSPVIEVEIATDLGIGRVVSSSAAYSRLELNFCDVISQRREPKY
jgi:hypothetical protein